MFVVVAWNPAEEKHGQPEIFGPFESELEADLTVQLLEKLPADVKSSDWWPDVWFFKAPLRPGKNIGGANTFCSPFWRLVCGCIVLRTYTKTLPRTGIYPDNTEACFLLDSCEARDDNPIGFHFTSIGNDRMEGAERLTERDTVALAEQLRRLTTAGNVAGRVVHDLAILKDLI